MHEKEESTIPWVKEVVKVTVKRITGLTPENVEAWNKSLDEVLLKLFEEELNALTS